MDVSFKKYRVVKVGNFYYTQYPYTLFGKDLSWFYVRTKDNNMNNGVMWFCTFILIPFFFIFPFFLSIAFWIKVVSWGLFSFLSLVNLAFNMSNYSSDNPKWVSSENSLKRELDSINREIEKNKEEEKTEVVGLYENGEYVEGTRLKRIKKLERIIKQ